MHLQAVCFSAEEYREQNIIGTRLAQARRAAGMNQRAVAEALLRCDITLTAAASSRWEKCDTRPNAIQLLALCDLYAIENPLAFFLGRDEKPANELNPQGCSLLDAIERALIASGQYTLSPTPRNEEPAEIIEIRRMRISRCAASAGTGQFLDDDSFELLDFPATQIPPRAEFGIRIAGDSMEPYYTDGQIVWVEQCHRLKPGEVGIFMLDGDGYIKQYHEELPSPAELAAYTFGGMVQKKISLRSFNPRYAPIAVSTDRFEICGRVLN